MSEITVTEEARRKYRQAVRDLNRMNDKGEIPQPDKAITPYMIIDGKPFWSHDGVVYTSAEPAFVAPDVDCA